MLGWSGPGETGGGVAGADELNCTGGVIDSDDDVRVRPGPPD